MRRRAFQSGLMLVLAFSSVSVMGAGTAQAQAFIHVPGVRVELAPPPARVEVQGVRPSANHQWLAGHWAWRNGRHEWLAGHWAMPAQPGMAWEPARWVNENGRYVFFEGHWYWPQGVVYEAPPVAAPVQEEVVVNAEPPAMVAEVRPPLPYAGAVWMPGFWHWQGGRHVWVAGRYTQGRPGYTWEAHRWERGPGGWRLMPGHWRR